jgi:hypothetical protein
MSNENQISLTEMAEVKNDPALKNVDTEKLEKQKAAQKKKAEAEKRKKSAEERKQEEERKKKEIDEQKIFLPVILKITTYNKEIELTADSFPIDSLLVTGKEPVADEKKVDDEKTADESKDESTDNAEEAVNGSEKKEQEEPGQLYVHLKTVRDVLATKVAALSLERAKYSYLREENELYAIITNGKLGGIALEQHLKVFDVSRIKDALITRTSHDGFIYEYVDMVYGHLSIKKGPAPKSVINPTVKEEVFLKYGKLPHILKLSLERLYKEYYEICGPMELRLDVVYNKKTNEYQIHCPEQDVTAVSIDYIHKSLPEHLVHVMNTHSHHVMSPYFSVTDIKEARISGIYMVFGNMDNKIGSSMLYSVNGNIKMITDDVVFDTNNRNVKFTQDTGSCLNLISGRVN